MTTTHPTLAEYLVQALPALGIDRVFGLPGGEVVQVLDELRRHDLPFTLTHHESSALFMADAVARLSGRPAAALTTLGPGATNAVSGMAHAYLDRSPVLCVTAQKPDSLLPDYTHQVLDLPALFGPISKGSFQLKAATAAETLQQAAALLTGGRPGPVHFQISNEDAVQPVRTPLPNLQPAPLPPVDSAALREAGRLLQQARRPLLLVGLGIEPEGPYAALRQLAEACGMPVIVTPKAKGCLPDDHPLAAGVIGLTRTDLAYDLLAEADCLLAVGFDVVELVKPWQHPAPLIWLANWPNHDPVLPAAVELVGQLEPALQTLREGAAPVDTAWGAARVADYQQRWVAEEVLPAPLPERLLPQTVLQVLRAALPPEALLTVDVGSHKIFASLTWPTLAPNRFQVSNGLSSMGFGLPAAIAAGMMLPQIPVVSLTGDAGLAMAMGELALLTRLQAPVLLVVLNDNALDLIRSHQQRAGKPVFGTEFQNPDFGAIAAAYGLPARRVTHIDVLRGALHDFLQRQRPMLIEVMLDPRSYPTTPR